MSKPITHGGTDRAYKLCRCSECGIVQQCTPAFDFYVRNDQPEDGPLTCERCIKNPHSTSVITVTE